MSLRTSKYQHVDACMQLATCTLRGAIVFTTHEVSVLGSSPQRRGQCPQVAAGVTYAASHRRVPHDQQVASRVLSLHHTASLTAIQALGLSGIIHQPHGNPRQQDGRPEKPCIRPCLHTTFRYVYCVWSYTVLPYLPIHTAQGREKEPDQSSPP